MQTGKRIRLEQHYGLLYMGLQIQGRVHLRLHQGQTINSEKIREDLKMSSNLPDALELYRAAWLILAKTEEIDAQETRLGFIGPGNGRLTRLLETLFGWLSRFR